MQRTKIYLFILGGILWQASAISQDYPTEMPEKVYTDESSTKEGGFDLRSPAFKPFKQIPKDYTCDGRNISPELVWGNLRKVPNHLCLLWMIRMFQAI